MSPIQAVAILRGHGASVQDSEYRKVIRRQAIQLFNHPSQLQVQPSTIPGAGNGVCCKSNLKAGTIVATYGGMYIPPIPTCGSPEPIQEPQHLIPIEGDYIYCCEGGGWIDGQGHLQPTMEHDVMQLVNHSTRPNTIDIVLYNFPSGLGVSAPQPGTPWYFSPEDASTISIPRNVLLKSAALVTLRDVQQGEELFLDYCINPPKWRPSWYEPAPNGYLETITESQT